MYTKRWKYTPLKIKITEYGYEDANGVLQGPRVFLFPDGNPLSIHTMKNGLKYGLVKDYHPNGLLAYEYNNTDNEIKDGEFKQWNIQGELIKHVIYNNGKIMEDRSAL